MELHNQILFRHQIMTKYGIKNERYHKSAEYHANTGRKLLTPYTTVLPKYLVLSLSLEKLQLGPNCSSNNNCFMALCSKF